MKALLTKHSPNLLIATLLCLSGWHIYLLEKRVAVLEATAKAQALALFKMTPAGRWLTLHN